MLKTQGQGFGQPPWQDNNTSKNNDHGKLSAFKTPILRGMAGE
jgi:hypothetical protein